MVAPHSKKLEAVIVAKVIESSFESFSECIEYSLPILFLMLASNILLVGLEPISFFFLITYINIDFRSNKWINKKLQASRIYRVQKQNQ